LNNREESRARDKQVPAWHLHALSDPEQQHILLGQGVLHSELPPHQH
jgi:hypothetical protein